MNHSFNALLNVHFIKSSSFSLIRLFGNVVYRVGQARRTEPSTLQLTEHLARVFILTVSYDVRFDSSKTGS